MDSFPKSDSPHIQPFDTPPDKSNKTRLLSRYNDAQDTLSSVPIDHHQLIHNHESQHTVEQKYI